MRALILTGLLVTALTSSVAAQTGGEAASSTISGAQPLALPAQLLQDGQITVGGPFAHPTGHCCSRRGALIGFAIGAGFGYVMSMCACETGGCQIGILSLSAGIGASVGAMVGSPSRTIPIAWPPHRRLAAAPLITRDVRGGALALRF